MPSPTKTWWAPVWRGLVVDPDGQHLRRLKSAVWLLLYLILHAERRTGIVRCRLATIVTSTAIPLRTVQRWLRVLRKEGYIRVRETGRVVHIDILRWRPVGLASDLAGQPRHSWREPRQSWRDRDGRESENRKHQSHDSPMPPPATKS